MRNFILALALSTATLVACGPEPDDDDATADDDDDATADDDDATADDDDATADDDDATADDDDSAGGPEACQDIPPPDPVEWTAVPSTRVWEGQGAWPSDGGSSWVWFLPTDAEVAAQYSEYGPLPGMTADGLTALFDEDTQDLVVITWWQDADGTCFEAGGLYTNNFIDCDCASFWLHQDWWTGGMLPAKYHTTEVWAVDDMAHDASPANLTLDVLLTVREIP